MASNGVQRMYLREISPSTANQDNIFVVAIIIAKQPPRIFPAKNNEAPRGVFNFTVRDSPTHYSNVSVWGSDAYVNIISSSFHIGDVVDLINVKSIFKKANERENLFQPMVTCQFNLMISERTSDMKLHNINDCAQFQPLLRLPTQPSSEVTLLQDIHSNNEVLRGKFVNVLVAVHNVYPIRQIKSKDGRDLETREVIVIDESCSKLSVQLWDADNVYRVENWIPHETVLFIAHLKVDWSPYKATMTGSIASRTIVTENPSLAETQSLKKFVQTVPRKTRAFIDQLASNCPDLNTITNVMSCKSITNKAAAGGFENMTALIYASLQDLDIDGLSPITVTKCKGCGMQVPEDTFTCKDPECQTTSERKIIPCETVFNLRVSLVDHTGCLRDCRLTSNAAQNLLGCSVIQFESLPEEKKTELKWEFLMTQCKARLLILPASREFARPVISVLSIEKVSDWRELTANLPMF
ncbi:meiosis-specific with OB domain-containing protein [Nilaparvata lugens]|uniref:meiosis-specific with OB domain-containing protein n=1 Tax=Nilaparvata lugens TaxID=108931 RepID=UPI00193D876F|nr:meiosis-specific with OB domain-containing protein [Nilaparvata lugens]